MPPAPALLWESHTWYIDVRKQSETNAAANFVWLQDRD